MNLIHILHDKDVERLNPVESAFGGERCVFLDDDASTILSLSRVMYDVCVFVICEV